MEPLIQAIDLTVKVGANTLLDKTSFNINPKEITLLVGGSGSGKTVLMKLLSGLIPINHPSFQISGQLLLDGENILGWLRSQKCRGVGIVFQDYGLLDDYSIPQNLDFAYCHSPFKIPRNQRQGMTLHLAEKLEINPKLQVKYASGGQKRRIAIARTLAYNPDIIIYDEPTTGLDPYLSRNVAQLIEKTHNGFHKKSSLVVTHEYQEFLSFAHRILFVDPTNKKIHEVSPQQLIKFTDEGRFQVPSAKLLETSWLQKGMALSSAFFVATTTWFSKFILYFLQAMLRSLPLWRSPKWGMRFFVHYLRLVSFLSSILYIGVSGAIIGFVSAYFIFRFLPYEQFTRPLITEDVLTALGFGLYRIIVPIFVSILVAARGGASVASDIGNRVYLQEIDSMKSLGASPSGYLQTGVIYAFLLGIPFLTFLAFFIARLVCFFVFLAMHPEYNAIDADALFHRLLRTPGEPWFEGTGWLLLKTLTCGFGLANICYYIGIRPKSSTRDISRDITFTVILGTLFVMATYVVFALLEFQKRW